MGFSGGEQILGDICMGEWGEWGVYTREQALKEFTDCPEFQFRVQEVIDAGCLP